MGWFLAVYHENRASAHRVGGQINFENLRIGNQSGKIRVENALFFEVSLDSLASQQAVSTVVISFAGIKSNGSIYDR